MTAEVVRPDWPAPARVHAFVSTRSLGNMREGAEGRERLRALVPADPLWLRQIHGSAVCDADSKDPREQIEADAWVVRRPGVVCAIQIADCMPVLLTTRSADVLGLAHAGWRGLARGVLENTLGAMQVGTAEVLAWLGPAIGPSAYEVGEEVRDEFTKTDPGAETAFAATRPAHWLLDLYAIARQRLARAGVVRVSGGDYCTYNDPARFYSFRRDRANERMAALAWLGTSAA